MKKILLISNLCLIVFFAQAQQNNGNAFTSFVSACSKSIKEATAAKDYAKGLAIINEVLARYNELSPELKKEYQSYVPNIYYYLARFTALEGQKEKAIAYFGQAVDAGYSNYAHAVKDSDLDRLRKDKRFRDALQRLREKGDYGNILKISGAYNVAQNVGLPTFSYQEASAPELVAFKNQFNLDSISGNGDEISKFKNLLYWAHNVVRHDGSSDNPKSRNAIDLIAVCKKENRGVNCRMMATILKDAYQAMGFKSRMVTCMPKDTADFDCHVINVVWSRSLNKWLWMDPTFNAYVSDNKGNLLSIEEVRARLINGSPLVLNDGANWNNQEKKTKENYLDYYMSKNLYWLKCAVKSTWDLETRKGEKQFIEYVNLYPGKYSTIQQQTKKISGDNISYATNNPNYFWQKP
ncbi:MAG: transglutaminase domain-containing protein [Candidatus Pedobacter colombiensis]|uniref:Transglutaminase domain-containing protein n=1 Tax=Candidatus Pedobacter colombiensis TaxID=3121371 RepID=A0AAJ5W859_9SPHI|nr:transglutaminase domain-containing protein [Pedobacter sp.]WEK18267.1 MAG: transglutaminase domain-containing protein [Pedobacter sp.]